MFSLAVLAISTVPNAFALISQPPTTIVHVEDPSLCSNNSAAPIQDLFAKYPDGNRVLSGEKVPHGTQLVIEALLSAHCYRIQNENGNYQLIALIEIRNAEGITKYLTYQQGEIKPWTESSVGISWIPEVPGEYEIRAFSIGDLKSTAILSQVVTIKITVV